MGQVPAAACCAAEDLSPDDVKHIQVDALGGCGSDSDNESERYISNFIDNGFRRKSSLAAFQELAQRPNLANVLVRDLSAEDFVPRSTGCADSYPCHYKRGPSYGELMPAMLEPTVIICCSAKASLPNLVNSLECWVSDPGKHAEGAARKNVAFSIDLKRDNAKDICCSETLLYIGDALCTVVSVEPWDSPTFVHDPVCLWQIYSTLTLGNHLYFTMCTAEQERFKEALLSSSEVVRQALSDFNTGGSDSQEARLLGSSATPMTHTQTLTDRVLSEIDRAMGLQRFRERVHTRLAEYFASCAQRVLANTAKCNLTRPPKELLQLKDNMARFLREQGSLRKAKAVFETLREECIVTHGPDSAETLSIENQLAVTLFKLGGTAHVAEAKEMHRQVLARRRHSLGPDKPDTLQSMSNLAVVLTHDDESTCPDELLEAQALFREALRARRSVYGEHHPVSLYTASNLGEMLSRAISSGRARKADVIEAHELHRICTEGFEKNLGSWHPLTLSAQYYQAVHKYACAQSDMAMDALGLMNGEKGGKSPKLMLTNDAKVLCHQVVQRRTEKLGQDHADTRECRQMLQQLRAELEMMFGERDSYRRKSMAMDNERTWKDVMPERFAAMHLASHFRDVRSFLRLYGVSKIFDQLQEMEFVDSSGLLSTGTKPFNVFARIGAGVMTQPQMVDDQKLLGRYQDKFVVACNRPECDENWESTDPAWMGKASMSLRHRFIVPRDIHWSWFNVLIFGMQDNLEDAIAMLKSLRTAAMLFTKAKEGWSNNVGLFFHVYSLSSVNALHLHVVDLDHCGPSYEQLRYRNLSLDIVLQILLEELSEEKNGESNRQKSPFISDCSSDPHLEDDR